MATAPAVTIATAMALLPSTNDGSANQTMTTKLIAKPARAPTPRHRPKAITATANRPMSTSSGVRRWNS